MEHVKKCEWCGGTFVSSRSDARFCSAVHRTAWNKGRKSDSPETPKPKPTPATITTGNATMNDVLAELKEIRVLLGHIGERVLSVDDVCRELGISKQTVERMVADGSIRLHRFGESRGTGRGRKPFVLFSEMVDALKRDKKTETL